jgi:hypothetical protein
VRTCKGTIRERPRKGGVFLTHTIRTGHGALLASASILHFGKESRDPHLPIHEFLSASRKAGLTLRLLETFKFNGSVRVLEIVSSFLLERLICNLIPPGIIHVETSKSSVVSSKGSSMRDSRDCGFQNNGQDMRLC